MIDYSFLKGKIVEKVGSCAVFAEKLGITKVELSRKLNNSSKFTQDQILLSKQILNLSEAEVDRCFFAEKNVEKS